MVMELNFRKTIEQCIDELYPEEQYPAAYFPDKREVLLRMWSEIATRGPVSNEADIRKKIFTELNLPQILQRSPDRLVLLYRRQVEILVEKKCFDAALREVLVQEILTRLLSDKIHKIKARFDPGGDQKASFTSYFHVIIRNLYYDIVRENKFKPLPLEENMDDLASEEQGETWFKNIVIE